jgi:hypothetical protein
MRIAGIALVIGWLFIQVAGAADIAAKITRIEGSADILKKGTDKARAAKVSMPLQIGDVIKSGAETLVEIAYKNGELVRMSENTSMTINESTSKTVKSEVLLGKVWVNMKKLSTPGREFEMSSPTATAAIRGTIFSMSSAADSTTAVDVYNGKVAVGPTGQLVNKLNQNKKEPIKLQEPTEISGPSEVAGPYEVSLEQWQIIVAGQRISVHADGKFATQTFDTTLTEDAFIRENIKLDHQ